MNCSRSTQSTWIIVLVVIASFVALGGTLMVGGALLVWHLFGRIENAVSRIEIDPQALAATMKQAVVVTLKDGSTDQRLQIIHTLRDMGADAKEFVPNLLAILNDADPQIRAAAEEALKKIDPDAAAKAGVK